MKVKLTTSMAGPEKAHSVGDEIEVSDAEAKRLIERGFAVPVRTNAKIERAVRKAKGA